MDSKEAFRTKYSVIERTVLYITQVGVILSCVGYIAMRTGWFQMSSVYTTIEFSGGVSLILSLFLVRYSIEGVQSTDSISQLVALVSSKLGLYKYYVIPATVAIPVLFVFQAPDLLTSILVVATYFNLLIRGVGRASVKYLGDKPRGFGWVSQPRAEV